MCSGEWLKALSSCAGCHHCYTEQINTGQGTGEQKALVGAKPSQESGWICPRFALQRVLLLVSSLAMGQHRVSALLHSGSGGLSSRLHKLMDLLVSTGDKWPGALFWSSQSCNKSEDPVSASVELTPSKEKLHSLATTTKHRVDPAQMRNFPWVDRSPYSLLVWLTDPCSDVWDPANKIITSSQSQSCFVGTMSFLSSLHLWRKSLSCSQGRSHNLH